MKPLLLLLLLLASPLAAQDAAAPTNAVPDIQAIRIRKADATTLQVQMPLIHYQRAGRKLDVYGAVHIADRSYYEDLNRRFKAYDRVLFEMVGGERIQEKDPDPADDPAIGDPLVMLLGPLYQLASRFLQLESQAAVIDYHAKNFIHADFTIREFNQALARENTSLLKMASELSARQPPNPVLARRLTLAIFTRSPDLIKLEIARIIEQSPALNAPANDDTILIGDRNRKAVEVLREQWKGGHPAYAIFYGSGHLPHLDTLLRAEGFTRHDLSWLPAWTIQQHATPPADKPGN